ncbi:MAG: RCC1 repeat-containing protein, partial [Pseudomonadota bacterium]
GVMCWGNNDHGQIGNNDDQRLTPDGARYVFDLYTGAAAVSGGHQHACAVTEAGAVTCWGQNGSGQVGDGTTETRLAPVEIDPGGVAVSVTGGGSHSCAVLDEGSMTCWGGNGSGQLGNGSTDGALTPSAVTGLASKATFACAGLSHSCALLDTGGVMCWGANDEGQLGNGTTTPSSVPVVVAGLTAGATALACGRNHSCAVREGGAICWGNNEHGSLGNGGTEDQLEPAAISDPGDDVSAVGCGDDHCCAVLASGDVACWGANRDNELGDGTLENSSVPVSVTGLGSAASAVACGGAHSCALLEHGNLRCWGHDQYGQVSGVNPGHAHVVYCE